MFTVFNGKTQQYLGHNHHTNIGSRIKTCKGLGFEATKIESWFSTLVKVWPYWGNALVKNPALL